MSAVLQLRCSVAFSAADYNKHTVSASLPSAAAGGGGGGGGIGGRSKEMSNSHVK